MGQCLSGHALRSQLVSHVTAGTKVLGSHGAQASCPPLLPSTLSTPLPSHRSKLLGCVSDGEAVFPCPLPPRHHRCSVSHSPNSHVGRVPGLKASSTRCARPSGVPRGPATSTGSLASQRHPGTQLITTIGRSPKPRTECACSETQSLHTRTVSARGTCRAPAVSAP